LKLTELFKEKLFDTPFTGIIITDEAGSVVRINGKMQAMTGYSLSDVENMCIASIFHQEHKDELYSTCKHMSAETRNRSGMNLKVRTDGGLYLDCRVSIQNITDTDGKIAGHAFYFEKVRDEALRKSYVNENGETVWVAIEDKYQKEEFLCNVFHGIQDSILILDISGSIISYNMKVLDLIGVNLEQMSDIGSFERISADDMNMRVYKRFLKEAYGGKDQLFTWQMKKPYESMLIDVEVFVTRIDKMGDDVLLASIRDITDKKRMEDSLKSSEYRYRQLVEHSPD